MAGSRLQTVTLRLYRADVNAIKRQAKDAPSPWHPIARELLHAALKAQQKRTGAIR